MLFRSPRDRRGRCYSVCGNVTTGTEAVQAASVSVGERRADASSRLFRLLYAARPLLREQSRDKIGAESGHVGVPRQQVDVKVMHGFREGADVDALLRGDDRVLPRADQQRPPQTRGPAL
jgi:hypothetical protein